MHILSCPSCMINIRFKDVNLTCSNNEYYAEVVCNSLCVIEPPYSVQSYKCVNSTVKNSLINFKSLTSQVNIIFVNRHPYSHAFTAEYFITSKFELSTYLLYNSGVFLGMGYPPCLDTPRLKKVFQVSSLLMPI